MRDLSKLVDELGRLTVAEAAQLATMLEARWKSGQPQPIKLAFNEGRVCDAVVRRLEERESFTRTNLRSPEEDGHQFPVELAFELGAQLFALEHTGIEPFDGHLEMEAQTQRLFAPITDALKDALGTEALFELQLPIHCLRGRKGKELIEIQEAIITWVKETAPTIPKRPYPDFKGNGIGPVKVGNVPFDVGLMRYEMPIPPRRHFQIRHLVENLDKLRSERMQAAIDKKFPKLAAWKDREKAKAILVLEQNDVQLTNPGIVADTYLPLVKDRSDRPDETYLVEAFPTGNWFMWPIQIGDRSYDDIVRSNEPSYWEFNPMTLNKLTNR